MLIKKNKIKSKDSNEEDSDEDKDKKKKKNISKEKESKNKKDKSINKKEKSVNESQSESEDDKKRKKRKIDIKKELEESYSDENPNINEKEEKKKKKGKSHKSKKKIRKGKNDDNDNGDILSEESNSKSKEGDKNENSRNRKRKSYKKEKSKKREDSDDSDSLDSDSDEKDNRSNRKKKKDKNKKDNKKENDSDYKDSESLVEEDSESKSYSSEKKKKNRKSKKGKDKKHKTKKETNKKKEKRKSYFSSDKDEEKKSLSSHSCSSDKKYKKNSSKRRSKSSISHEEKKKEEEKEKSSEENSDNQKIIDDLKKSIKSSSESESEETKSEQKNIGVENKERNEENVTKYIKIIKEDKTSFGKLTSRNKSGKFLMDEKNKNKHNQKSLQYIIDNFLETDTIIKKYISEFKSDEKKKNFFKKQGFILTDKSMERMALLIHYILNGIPVLFEGNTGTSKTRTTLTACNYIKKFIKKGEKKIELVRYNLSAETKIDDIIAKYVSDQKSFIGLKVQNGPFIDAYVNGKILLFDEINLAPANVLQCVQQSLDNGFLSVETNGRCLLKYEKNSNFALVATQNPNKGAFAGKRQELGPEFLSRFQKIYFPDILREEMQEIALGIAKNVEYITKDEKNKKQLLKDIVNLHYEWAKETDSQTDIQCFTIREIESVIECLSNGEEPYEVIMTIYGGRFRQEKKEKLNLKLLKFDSLKNLKQDSQSFDVNFPNCFKNDSLIQTVKSVLLALRNKRNVIIVGNDESGLTQIAEWCSHYYNKELSSNRIDEKFICFCTKNLECTDLIGTQKISNSKGDEDNNELIKFEPRFLYKSIIEGKCVVLDCINEAPSRVIERLNGLLDKKNSDKEAVFEVPENTKKPIIKINKDFRIICTSNFEKINQISPAFVNRFEVIVLEDQLKGLSELKMKNLIKLLCNKYQEECYYNYKKRKEKMKLNNGKKKKNKETNDPFGEIYLNEKKTKIKIKKNIEFSQEIIELILEKIIILSKGRNPNDSSDDSTSSSSIGEKVVDENSKKYLTMSSINKFCRTIIILFNKFKSQENITQKSIIDFSFELLFEEHLTSENKEIQQFLIEELIESNKQVRDLGDEQYYFDKSESLKKFMVQMYACSLVNQYLCIIGPPGIGKTIGARAFSYIREIIFGLTYDSPFYMHTFNQFTRPSDYYGISSIKDERLVFRDGTLTKSIKNGNIFIGDEFNISSEDCMKAITPILELKFGEEILIPGIENEISIDPDFFFIICQNTKNTFGRKDLPEKIKVKIKVINYPDRVKEEIENICESICDNLFKERKERNLTKDQARKCGDFMMLLNEKEVLTPWSLRDISKLFARLNKQSINPKNYVNLNVIQNILFYILSSTNESLLSERLPVVIDLIAEIFKLSTLEKQSLSELYNATPFIKNVNNKIFIEKSDVSIFYCNYNQEIFENLKGLPSVLNALFKILITSDDEPILISGPSSYKTFLAKLLFVHGKSEVISLNSESTISQLIGSSTLLSSEKSKNK